MKVTEQWNYFPEQLGKIGRPDQNPLATSKAFELNNIVTLCDYR